jgi:hypothetical protein
MPERIDDEPSPRGPGGTARRNKSDAAEPAQGKRPKVPKHIECEVHDGVPTVSGKARAHYRTGPGGRRMLVVDRHVGQRIRINATTEIVVLEISPDVVTIAVETAPGKL